MTSFTYLTANSQFSNAGASARDSPMSRCKGAARSGTGLTLITFACPSASGSYGAYRLSITMSTAATGKSSVAAALAPVACNCHQSRPSRHTNRHRFADARQWLRKPAARVEAQSQVSTLVPLTDGAR